MISFRDKALRADVRLPARGRRRAPGLGAAKRASANGKQERLIISLPSSVKQYLEEQVRAGVYPSVSEYVRQLVRADQKRQAKEELEQALLDAIQSGDSLALSAESIEQLRQMRAGRETPEGSSAHPDSVARA